MKNLSALCIMLAILAGLLTNGCTTEKYDIIIANGLVYDGTGSAPFQADIGISNGIITGIGKSLHTSGAVIIDASNRIVAPGFIDIHTHCDGQVLREGMNTIKNYLTQGVTTVVSGNCGSGTADVAKFFQTLDSIGIGANMVHLTGHNAIRSNVMGSVDREPSHEEMEKMKILLAKALDEGAAGISTGLFYTPAAYSKTGEMIELSQTVKQYDGFVAIHLRDESNYNIGLENSVLEAIEIGEQSGARVQIAHLKALGKPVWGLSAKVSDIIHAARKRGVVVFADQYPYNASSTGLTGALVPAWVRSDRKMAERMTDAALLPQIKREIAENIERRGGPESLVIVSYPKDPRFSGKNLAEISAIINQPVVETAIFLVLDGSPGIVSFNMNDKDVERFMQNDFVMTGSDGSIVIPGESFPHPRSYGSFPRKVRKFVIEEKVISMEQFIRSATSMPAAMIGLTDRGTLKTGMVAEIVVFDPETIRDNATFADPHQYSTGIDHLLVNGIQVIENGQYNGKLAGKPLKVISNKTASLPR